MLCYVMLCYVMLCMNVWMDGCANIPSCGLGNPRNPIWRHYFLGGMPRVVNHPASSTQDADEAASLVVMSGGPGSVRKTNCFIAVCWRKYDDFNLWFYDCYVRLLEGWEGLRPGKALSFKIDACDAFPCPIVIFWGGMCGWPCFAASLF